MALEEERKFQEFVIDRILPIDIALEQVDGISRDYHGKCFCPFHDNTDTPAAHLYKTENGTHLMCFAERKSYRPHDVFRLKLVKTPLSTVFGKVWRQLSDEKRTILEQKYGVPTSSMPKSWAQHQEDLDRFKLGLVTLPEHVINVAKALTEER